jgi:hypothetical protein
VPLGAGLSSKSIGLQKRRAFFEFLLSAIIQFWWQVLWPAFLQPIIWALPDSFFWNQSEWSGKNRLLFRALVATL